MSSEYRIVMVGASGVGKTSLAIRFVQGSFIQKRKHEGEEIFRKQVEVNGEECMLDIMDTPGQEEYSALRDQYMKSGEGFIVVYSITSMSSFLTADKMHQNILRLKESHDVPIILVGNKIDLESDRKVTTEQARDYASQKKMCLIETSAKANRNVNEIFYELVHRINEWRLSHPPTNDSHSQRNIKKSQCVLL